MAWYGPIVMNTQASCSRRSASCGTEPSSGRSEFSRALQPERHVADVVSGGGPLEKDAAQIVDCGLRESRVSQKGLVEIAETAGPGGGVRRRC